ncbi:hypothetical protein BH23ACT6_BH23ACT6_18720 [soil metagenome]
MSPARRVYLSLERSDLHELHARGVVPPGLPVHCVTDSHLSRANTDASDDAATDDAATDNEKLEFIALQQAARYALGRAIPAIIAAADVPESALTTAPESSFVTSDAVPVAQIVSFHLSDEALGAIDVTHPAAVDDKAALELSWFDVTELPLILHENND